jgi:hypothetical protein
MTTATLIAKGMKYYDRPVAWLTRRNINSALVSSGGMNEGLVCGPHIKQEAHWTPKAEAFSNAGPEFHPQCR